MRLRAALASEKYRARANAARLLGACHPGEVTTAPALAASLGHDEDPWVRRWAAWALGRVARALVRTPRAERAPASEAEGVASLVLAALPAALADCDPHVHREVVVALAHARPLAGRRPSHPAFDGHSQLGALLGYQRRPPSVWFELADAQVRAPCAAADDGDPRHEAAAALRAPWVTGYQVLGFAEREREADELAFRVKLTGAVDSLPSLLSHPRDDVRTAAARALRTLSDVEPVVLALDHADGDLRREAAYALRARWSAREIDVHAHYALAAAAELARSVRALYARLQDPRDDVRFAAAAALCGLKFYEFDFWASPPFNHNRWVIAEAAAVFRALWRAPPGARPRHGVPD